MSDKTKSVLGKILSTIVIITFIVPYPFIGQAFAEDKKAETSAEKPAPAASAVADKAGAAASHQPAVNPVEVPVQSKPQAQEEVKAPEAAASVEPGNVTVNFKGADIKTVLAYISEVAGVDIVAAPDVKGIIDLKLSNKPWKAALDIIVKNYGFAYEREGDIIRVVTLDKLKQEELTTQAFSLNYSKSKDVITSLANMVGERGKVVYDERTNTVLVTDIPTNIYRISQIIGKLDKRTEQVLIEARIIETVLGNDEKMGVDWTIKASIQGAARPTTLPFEFFKTPFESKQGEGKQFFPQVLTAPPQTTTETVGGATVVTTSGDFPATAAGYFGFPFAPVDSFKFGTLDFSEFKAVLEMLESRSDTDTISNPRIATLNNSKATINVGEVIYFPTFERNSTTGKMEITGYAQKDSGIVLNVTLHVNDIGEIAMELAPQITAYLGTSPISPGSDIFAPQFRTREAKTQVMVRDGQTIFIGGLISERDVDRRTKMPIIGDLLGDVPYVGLLFSHRDIVKERVELIFFITVHLMTPDKEIKGVPLPSKAYVPIFSETQRGNTANNKKRPKKQY